MRSFTQGLNSHSNEPATMRFVRRHAPSKPKIRQSRTRAYRPTKPYAAQAGTGIDFEKGTRGNVGTSSLTGRRLTSSTPGVIILLVTTGIGPDGLAIAETLPAVIKGKQLRAGIARQATSVTTQR